MSKTVIRIIYMLALALAFLVAFGIGILLDSKTYFYKASTTVFESTPEVIEPFPVGVNQWTKTIVEQPNVGTYYSETLALVDTPRKSSGWSNQLLAIFSNSAWYQNLASPVSRSIVIWPGERHEEIKEHIGSVLGWSNEDEEVFVQTVMASAPILSEGKFIPGRYVAHRGAKPEEVATMVTERFGADILERYTNEVSAQVSLEDALTIASLIEREASDFENMREVSGVIWNRLFIDMPLQLDATLQYARGSRSQEPKWWPVPRPQDKYIDSPFNTYKNTGLPPAPISNPSVEAVIAALNPRESDCLFYFHDNKQNYYCSPDYETHVMKLKQVFGRGK